MLKLILFLVVFSFGLMVIGVPELIRYVSYLEPVVVIYDRSAPVNLLGYVHLKQMQLRGREAVTASGHREGAKVYVPVHRLGETGQEPVFVVLESDNPNLLVATTRLGGRHRVADELNVLQIFATKHEAIGIVHPDFSDHALRDELHRRMPMLAPEFVFLREGERPTIALAVITLSVAAAMQALLYWIWRRYRAAQEPEPPPFLPRPPVISPRAASTRRYPPGRRE